LFAHYSNVPLINDASFFQVLVMIHNFKFNMSESKYLFIKVCGHDLRHIEKQMKRGLSFFLFILTQCDTLITIHAVI
jgi:hypothetical protein